MNTVFITRRFDQSPGVVFRALTTPDSIMEWFGPPGTRTIGATVDLCPGGSYCLELGTLNHKSNSFTIEGVYRVIEKPNKLVFTMNYVGLPDQPGQSLVSIRLNPTENGGTELLFKQTFAAVPANMQNRAQAWQRMFDRLTVEIGH